jgi:uncharacterized protein (DUF427 family)
LIRLYRAPYSTNVERVALALAHKGLAVESVVIDYADRGPVEAVSGQGLVPVIEEDGEVVADSRRPHAVFENPLPTRWYLPADDVRWELLEPSDTVTRCPYKGTTEFFGVRAGGALHPDRAWSYRDPIPECPAIKGLVCFFNEHVDLIVDEERLPRPFTPWSLSPAS